MYDYNTIIHFWFNELQASDWREKDPDLDRHIIKHFRPLYEAAAACELYPWRTSPTGRLAELIVLDQFPRHIYRDLPASFASDALSLGLAQEAIARGEDQKVETSQRRFFYMPHMHSESRLIHAEALKLFRKLGDEADVQRELRHKVIIDRFGRYPHRNAILGRTSTPEEIQFLKQPNSSF